MGQFGNQPDFGTKAQTLTPIGDNIFPNTGYFINPPCALYVGTGGDLVVTIVGGDDYGTYGNNTTTFKNVPGGTFLPIMVSYVWEKSNSNTVTTATDIVGLY